MSARAIAVAAILVNLGGCFFAVIPGSVIDTVAGKPAYCARTGVQVGDMLRLPDGSQRKVVKVSGESGYYCRQAPEGMRVGVDVAKN
jgi:hypothetical protein